MLKKIIGPNYDFFIFVSFNMVRCFYLNYLGYLNTQDALLAVPLKTRIMSEVTQSYPALFLGRRVISGLIGDEKLKQLVAEISREYPKPSSRTGSELVSGSSLQIRKHAQDESRCNLEVADRHLHVTYIRKDEGFESDGESTKSSSNSMESANNSSNEKSQIHSDINNLTLNGYSNQPVATNSAGFEVKIVKDHVFRHPSDSAERHVTSHQTQKSQASPSASLELESSFSAASSGSDYDEFKSSGPHSVVIKEKSKTNSPLDQPTFSPSNHVQNRIKVPIHVDANSSEAATSSSATSKSNSPTADLQRYKFDHKETYSIKDVIKCHVDKRFGSQVAWVIRSSKRNILVLVFECAGGELDVQHISKQFNEMRKRSKFEFTRRRKTIEPVFDYKNSNKSRNAVSKSVEVLLGRNKKGISADPLMLTNDNLTTKTKKGLESSISYQSNTSFNTKTLFETPRNGKDLELINGHEHHPSLMTLTHDNVNLRHYSHQQSHKKTSDLAFNYCKINTTYTRGPSKLNEDNVLLVSSFQ